MTFFEQQHVARRKRGAKLADLPVEQPTKLDLAINLKTAKALGLKMPKSILLRADRDLGLFIGITGWICDERRGRHLIELVKEIPGDRLLIETDSPYLTPRDLRPQPRARRNEPGFLPHILRALARALDRPAEEVGEETARNARELFALPQI